MPAFPNAPSKTPVRFVDPGERFSQRSGPVKVLVKNGKVLAEPEWLEAVATELEMSPYRLKKGTSA